MRPFFTPCRAPEQRGIVASTAELVCLFRPEGAIEIFVESVVIRVFHLSPDCRWDLTPRPPSLPRPLPETERGRGRGPEVEHTLSEKVVW